MNKRFYFIYRFLTIASLSCGLILNLINTPSPLTLMGYFTMQSNFLCLFVLIFFPVFKPTHNTLYYLGKGSATTSILLTSIVYLMALLPNNYSMCSLTGNLSSKAIGNLLVHVISPILVLLDYFLFDEKGKFKSYYPWFWILFPILYVRFVYLFHSKGGSFYNIGGSKDFAYFFLDYQKVGIIGVCSWMLKIFIFVIILGYLLVWIDKKLACND